MGEEIALSAQDRMEEEINQHIRISDRLAKEELFEYLTRWVNYFEFNLNNTQRIEEYINNYNEKRLIEYKTIVELEEAKFKETNKYKTLNHLDFYEVEYNMGILAGYLQKNFYNSKSRLEQYRKFFEAPDPDLIDIDYLPQYIEIMRPIVSRCVHIAKKRLSYLKGENELKQLPEKEVTQKTLDKPLVSSQSNRLKVNLTVEELTMLFRLLKDCRLIIIKPKHEKDIHSFISENFETIGLEDKKSSIKNIGRLWSSKDPAVLNSWIAKFKELSEKAEKK